jgi:hypothetical protein
MLLAQLWWHKLWLSCGAAVVELAVAQLAVVARAQHLDGFKGVVDRFKLAGIAGHPIGTIKRNVPGSKHINNTKVARRKVATHRVPWPPAGAAALLG